MGNEFCRVMVSFSHEMDMFIEENIVEALDVAVNDLLVMLISKGKKTDLLAMLATRHVY